MRYFIFIGVLCILFGGGILYYGEQLPVYNDPGAPNRIAVEVESLPHDQKSKEWYARLKNEETKHKEYCDFARGLIAAGIGFLCALRFVSIYNKKSPSFLNILVIWIFLWLVRIPLTGRYYRIRQNRSEFPPWGDTIIIPIASETVAWIIGALLTSFFLWCMYLKYPLPPQIRLVKPKFGLEGFRFVFILLWIAFLLFCCILAIPQGDEGMAFSTVFAAAILLPFLCARKVIPKLEELEEGGLSTPLSER
jgi:hypothetical protein